jgi:hypothetical protein
VPSWILYPLAAIGAGTVLTFAGVCVLLCRAVKVSNPTKGK